MSLQEHTDGCDSSDLVQVRKFVQAADEMLSGLASMLGCRPRIQVAVIGACCGFVVDFYLSAFLWYMDDKLKATWLPLSTKCTVCAQLDPRFKSILPICEKAGLHYDLRVDLVPSEVCSYADLRGAQMYSSMLRIRDFAPFVELRDALRGAVPKACDGVDTMSGFNG